MMKFRMEDEMRKTVILSGIVAALFVCAFMVSSQGSENWNGYHDTARISGLTSTTYQATTKTFYLGSGENWRVICLASDTSVAGYASDSISFAWGYQTGNIVNNSSGNRDTAWGAPVILDTMVTASYTAANSMTKSTCNQVGTMTATNKLADTLSVSGYATQSRNPTLYGNLVWNVLVRYWAQGVGTTNKVAAGIVLIFQHAQKSAINTKGN